VNRIEIIQSRPAVNDMTIFHDIHIVQIYGLNRRTFEKQFINLYCKSNALKIIQNKISIVKFNLVFNKITFELCLSFIEIDLTKFIKSMIQLRRTLSAFLVDFDSGLFLKSLKINSRRHLANEFRKVDFVSSLTILFHVIYII
jgi:hypothetical protein